MRHWEQPATPIRQRYHHGIHEKLREWSSVELDKHQQTAGIKSFSHGATEFVRFKDCHSSPDSLRGVVGHPTSSVVEAGFQLCDD